MKYYRNLIVFDLFRKERDSLCICLGIRRTSRKCGMICESILIGKITEREAVADNDLLTFSVIYNITKFTVELFELFDVCGCV